MSEKFEELLKLAAVANFDKEISENINHFEYDYRKVNLEDRQQSKLAEKVLLLPPKGMFAMFGKYCFHLTPSEIETFFQIEKPKGYLLFYQKMLSLIMGLGEGQLISDDSMKHACKAALNEYYKKELYADDNQMGLRHPKLKVGFRKLVKKVAVAAIIATMSFSTMMVANAEFRERVISWMIETFEKYSIFELKNDEAQTIENLQKYVPSYIPIGFELENTVVQPSLVLFEYSNENTDYLDILMSISDTRVYMDTEGVSIEELEVQGSTAYYFKKDNVECLVFEKDGFHFEVYGCMSKNDLIMVAEGINNQ
ncbi:MAG: DUF4367 domain-containing protein [Anaerotignum sp.]|nr:DUF4367 domain-containing protein [Anaerotignum sp.]